MFFDEFSLIRKSNCYIVKYDNKHFLTIKLEALSVIFFKLVHKKFLETLSAKNEELSLENNKNMKDAIKIESLYTMKRRIYLNNAKIPSIKRSSKEFIHFIKAVSIIKLYECSHETFIDAQIKGLEFVKKFPTPSQLSNSNSGQRVAEYISSKNVSIATGNNEGKIWIKPSEREIPLTENKRFIAMYDKLKTNTATLAEAEYVRELYKLRREGKVPPKIREYIKRLKNVSAEKNN